MLNFGWCYKRIMPIRRALICLLLCFAIPIQGIASIAMVATHCPMQQMTRDASADAAALPGCCNDADTFAKTGKACKTGQPCQSVSQYPNSAQQFHAPVSVQPILFSSPALLALSDGPTGIWRPPALI